MLRAGVNMALRLFLGQEQAGALQNILGLQLPPGQSGRIPLGIDGNTFAVDDNGVFRGRHRSVEFAVHGIVLQHIGQIIRGTQVVDADDLNVWMVCDQAHDHAADASETVDTDFNAHKTSSSLMAYGKHMICLTRCGVPVLPAAMICHSLNLC